MGAIWNLASDNARQYFDERYRPISGTKLGSYSSLELRTAFAFKILLCQPNRPQNLPVTHKGNIGFTHLKVPQLSHFAATLLNSPWRTARNIVSDCCYSESFNLTVNIDRVPYKPHIRELSPVAVAQQYLPLFTLAVSILVMPVVAFLSQSLTLGILALSGKSGPHQSALGVTLLAFELLLVYVVLGTI
jgi:hypothetical protein